MDNPRTATRKSDTEAAAPRGREVASRERLCYIA
jgi:hypothetical protein